MAYPGIDAVSVCVCVRVLSFDELMNYDISVALGQPPFGLLLSRSCFKNKSSYHTYRSEMQFELQLHFQCKKLLITFYSTSTPPFMLMRARARHSWLYPYLHSHLHQICCGSTYTWTFLLSFRDPEDHLWRVFLKQVRAHRVWREAHHLKASIHLLYIGVHAWSRRILRRVQPALFFCRSYRISDSHRVE